MQRGLCALCGKSEKQLEVDHDHDTALIRGLLCHSCSIVESVSGDRPKLVAYRLHPPAEGRGWVYVGLYGPEMARRQITYDELSEEAERVFADVSDD